MKNKKAIQEQQSTFIEAQKKEVKLFVDRIDKNEIETILLSGSVARGDYFPGVFGGMIDLIVMKKKGSNTTVKDVFGPNQDPEIPFHCIKSGDTWFQILFTDFIDADSFVKFDEAKKFSILESKTVYDPNDSFEKELVRINEIKKEECATELKNKAGYIGYLLSDYKKDRWLRRKAILQLHENLNTAIRMGILCLYYKNNSYAPAEDRQLYYSLTLENLPAGYEKIISRLKNQNTSSILNYKKREKLFRKTIVAFLEN